jgi:DNA-binding CsgD family transcriptional regulator/pimeloyl-ACP methyl ester carboxylesterase
MVFSPVGHLLVELENPDLRSFFEALAAHFTLVRYDRLGTGMSDRVRAPNTLTLDAEVADWFTRLRRESSDGEMAASAFELWARTDLRDLLGHVSAPTLVLHRREDPVVPVELGRALAALIPYARFELLDGSWHQPWLGDVAAVLTLAGDFFGFTPPAAPAHRNPAPTLTAREREVLRLVAQGLNDAGIAERLVVSAHTVHRHVANIRNRLGQPSRAAAAAHAARHGLI